MAPLKYWLSDSRWTNILSQSAADDDGSRRSTNMAPAASIRASDVSGRRGAEGDEQGQPPGNIQERPVAATCYRAPSYTMLERRGELYAGEKPAEPILPGALRIRLASPLLGDH